MDELDTHLKYVGRVPSRGAPADPPARRLRRLHRVWPDQEGNISYLLTICVGGRLRLLDNASTFERVILFLLDSPARYDWYGRRFVIMPDHVHLIAHMGYKAAPLGQWIKAFKAVVGGLERTGKNAGGLRDAAHKLVNPAYPSEERARDLTRVKRAWRWQAGFHDHKLRTVEAEQRKWEYICLNPVRSGLVKHPEEWPFGGEIYYDDRGGPAVVRGTPPLLNLGKLMEKSAG